MVIQALTKKTSTLKILYTIIGTPYLEYVPWGVAAYKPYRGIYINNYYTCISIFAANNTLLKTRL